MQTAGLSSCVIAIVSVLSAQVHGLRFHKNLIRTAAVGKASKDGEARTRSACIPRAEQSVYLAKAAGNTRCMWNWVEARVQSAL